jgi:hypothetical protein
LVELEERREKAFEHLVGNEDKAKGKFDKKASPRIFRKVDIVLMWDKKNEKSGKHGTFDNLWLAPCKIKEVASFNTFYLSHLDGEKL